MTPNPTIVSQPAKAQAATNPAISSPIASATPTLMLVAHASSAAIAAIPAPPQHRHLQHHLICGNHLLCHQQSPICHTNGRCIFTTSNSAIALSAPASSTQAIAPSTSMYREMKWSVVNRKHIYAHVNHREMFLSIQFTIESYHYHLKDFR
jgi:hypothetical protein